MNGRRSTEFTANANVNYKSVEKVYIASDNIISSFGFSTAENISAIKAGHTGIKLHDNSHLSPFPFWASLIDAQQLPERFSEFGNPSDYTRFEQLVICSAKDALQHTDLEIKGERTLFILSTTKGNVELLHPGIPDNYNEDRLYLWNTAKLLQRFFGLYHTPQVVSNACISGVVAIMMGARLIRSGKFDHVVVTGADLVSEFVLSGFGSFQSLCPGPCMPFDKDRKGLSLGEAAGTVILTKDPALVHHKQPVMVGPGFCSNDANHISGPSRTGEGLYIAIRRTLEAAREKVDYVSAHGTATPYNDEMESIALTRAGLEQVPVNSLKGYWGHTLGAAGVIESVCGIHTLYENFLFKTLGFSELGVTHPVAVISENRSMLVRTCLKIASGFGGSNASLLFLK
jgi:3-oxoacyl-[acyl-carrier-protein] synthase I